MALQWVDITTIDNNTPFMKVRWKAAKWKGGSGPDCWFAEAPGLTTDNMSWNQGTKDYGWYSAHRMNGGSYLGYPIYGCSFNFDHTQSGYWDVSGRVYRDHTKDTSVTASGFYDTTVQINGVTYYEIDFSLWANASGYSLYMPYSNPLNKWNAGDIYVEVGNDEYVFVEPGSVKFNATGGTKQVLVSSTSDWQALYDPTNWYHLSPSAGTSGNTTVTVSVDNYSSTVAERTVDITFENLELESTSLRIIQKKVPAPGSVGNVFLGDSEIEGCYLGDLEVEACYVGDELIFPTGPFVGIKISPSSQTFKCTGGTGSFKVKSSEAFSISYDNELIDIDFIGGSSGETIVPYTAYTNTSGDDYTTIVTAYTTTSPSSSATTSITIKKYTQSVPDIPNNQVWYRTSDSANISASGEMATANVFDGSIVSDVYDANEGYRIATFSQNITSLRSNGYKYSNRDSVLREIILPPSITSVGDYAFNQVSKLESIKFSNSCVLSSVGHEAFCECKDLLEVRMPTVSGAVGFWSWMGLSAATAITFVETSGVTSWHQGMSAGAYECFSDCASLQEFLLPGNVVTFQLYDNNKRNYPTTSMTETAWANLFDSLG